MADWKTLEKFEDDLILNFKLASFNLLARSRNKATVYALKSFIP